MPEQLITVVMPVYNGAATLHEAISSLQAQTYPHWQLQVHDNCSTDESHAIVESFADERIKLISYDTFVPAWQSWNRCLGDIKGDFFQLLCADDHLHPDCFSEKMKLAAMAEYADVVLFSSNRMLINKYGKPMFEIGYSKKTGVFALTEIMQKAYKVINPIGDPSTCLIRSRAITALPFTDQYPFFIDIELWMHVLQKGKMLHIPRVLSYFRVVGGTLSATNFLKNYKDTIIFYQQCISLFYKENRFKYYLGYIYFTYRALARELLYRLIG